MSAPDAAPQHLVRLADLPRERVESVLSLAARMKEEPPGSTLPGRTVGMLFFRSSLRTRASFEAAVQQLGGHVVPFTATTDLWELEVREGVVMDGRAPEHIRDASTVLSRYVDALAIRSAPEGRSWSVDRQDAQIQSWAEHAEVPVVNMESALWHPLQALADLLTLRETLGELKGRRVSIQWVRSPQPASASVVHSLMHALLREGCNVALAHPPGFELDRGVLEEARTLAGASGAELTEGATAEQAADGAAVIYARSWQSLETYGNPTLTASHRSRLHDWQVDQKLLDLGDGARLMHAMPVRRNVEVTDEVLDGESSLVYRQAENRLVTQKALLTELLG
jgi:N-acetylornithine carbamoyltransferase